jgi:predicted phosphohydrolase
MFFRLFSDLHNEFSTFEMIPLETDKDDVLVLAGDIGVAKALETFDPILEWAPRFRRVIQICGNHEYYHGSLLRVKDKIREKLGHLPNWTLADNNVVQVDNVSFICATLWTDMNKGDALAMHAIRAGLNDYNYIRTGPNLNNAYLKKISPHDIRNEHLHSKEFIFRSIVEEKVAGQKTVVVSHHGPCTKSIDYARYGNDIINWAYVSDLSNEILDTEPDFMVHGHTHTSFDYMIGDHTRLITNPRGYAAPMAPPENPAFNPILRIEV